MAEPYYITSSVTGKSYDIFSAIRILNIQQVAFYMNQGIELQDIEVSQDRKTGLPILVFYFNKEDTKEAYDIWCNQERSGAS